MHVKVTPVFMASLKAPSCSFQASIIPVYCLSLQKHRAIFGSHVLHNDNIVEVAFALTVKLNALME